MVDLNTPLSKDGGFFIEYNTPVSRQTLITEILTDLKQPGFRATQINEAIYQKGLQSYNDITNLPLNLREALVTKLGPILTLKVLHSSAGDQAEKILFQTPSGHLIESVLLKYKGHTALCLSSQSGCPLGCQFCATGAVGFKKNLETDEILDQYLYFLQLGVHIDSLIFMGMGEPFLNIDNLFPALKIFTDPKLIGLSPRRLSISTVGIVPGIQKLTAEYPNINLAFSLHTPFPEERSTLMPVNKTYPVSDVFAALDQYIYTTKNKVFVAYTLLKGYNDDKKHADELVKLLRSRRDAYLYHVNLIRYNPCPSKVIFERSDPNTIKSFQDVLTDNHISNTLRQDFGVNIDAACGQLYAEYLK